MSTPEDQPRRRGFLSNLSAALTPPIVTDDDPDEPLVTPSTVTVASILTGLAAAAFLFLGISQLVNLENGLTAAVQSYNKAYDQAVTDCTAEFGGINDKAVIPEGAAEDVTTKGQSCQALQPLTQDMIDGARTQATVIAWVAIVFGVVAIGLTWYLRTGSILARRILVGILAFLMVMSMFLRVSTLESLLATLLLVVAVLLCYLGKGGVFFARAALRRKAA